MFILYFQAESNGMIKMQTECVGSPSSVASPNSTHNTSSSGGSNNIGVRGSVTIRERALQAVEYYNSNVLRARVGAGLASSTRSSVNERHLFHGRTTNTNRLFVPSSDNLYRSNSSLELLHEHSSNSNQETSVVIQGGPTLRREYGSHGSIDVISNDRTPTTGESFFAMLQDYRPAVLGVIGTDQRSPGPSEYLKGKVMDQQAAGPPSTTHSIHSNNMDPDQLDKGNNGSPKLRMKLHRLWGPTKPARASSHIPSLDDSHIIATSNYNSISCQIASSSPDIEERQRRRAFAHFDCQSLTANLGYAAKLREILLARRRNTTTGASAASMLSSRSATPDGNDSGDEDYGDGQNNDLLDSCPYFRNEIGGEEEREVSLTRMQNQISAGQTRRAIHRPTLAYGVSILECAQGETLWKNSTCPFQKGPRPIETVDAGAKYYRQHFLGQEHQNWFGMDDQLGPLAISIKREKLPDSETQHQFRMIIRTSELLTLRGSVIEDFIPNPRGVGKHVTTKEVLEYVAQEIQINCLRLGLNTPQCEQQLLKLDEQGLTNKYKIGILYCRAGQSSEEDMYNNEEAGPAFTEFLDLIGKKVRLKGFENYKAGLDNKTDSTGTHSLYATYQDCEVMFHVSTMLPFTPNNRQQLLRKRHIGNDIVTVVFQEPGALPFTPKSIRSQFQHVFVIVRVVNPCSDNTHYRVAVSRSKEVPVFGPPIRPNAYYSRGKNFADFLLAKVINAENAAHRSEKFATMATRTRQEYLKDLTTNYVTTQLVDTGAKFSIFPSKKKDKPKIRFSGDLSQRGAFCWQVVLHDSGQSASIDCFLGISSETFILIEESSRQIVFVTPCKSILGWSTNGNSLRIYHHQGECITLNMRDSGDRDEQLEVIERLRATTQGCGAIELNLRRNPMGQLGFHVQPDGVVTQVEMSGQAWTAGLRQGYRLVEICKVAVATLSHDQMVDLLKTSAQVTVTVIESFADFTPRRGCYNQSCKFNMMNYESEYENMNDTGMNQLTKSPSKSKMAPAGQLQAHGHHRRRYERNFSPPRSSNSSGYGTGSSSRSFSIPNEMSTGTINGNSNSNMGTLTSSSSGHSSNDERWYDIIEGHDYSTPHHQKAIHTTSNTSIQTRPLSIHEISSDRMNKIPDQRPLPRTANIEYLVTRTPKRNDSDGNITDTSSIHNEPIYNKIERLNLISDREDENPSGDELTSMSSRSNHPSISKSKSTSSTVTSRNNSPRPNPNTNAEAKLRTTRNTNHHIQQQRNSVNYTSTTLQEDLMKLINPDYMAISDDNFHGGAINSKPPQKNTQNSHSLGNISNLTAAMKPTIITDDLMLLKKKSRSREGINLGHHPTSLGNFKMPKPVDEKSSSGDKGSEVIFTTARPATVISSGTANSSPASSEKNVLLHIKEDGNLNKSPRKNSIGIINKRKGSDQPTMNGGGLADMKDMDWTSLVDTATRAMLQVSYIFYR